MNDRCEEERETQPTPAGPETAATSALIRRKRRHAAHEIIYLVDQVRLVHWNLPGRKFADKVNALVKIEREEFTWTQIAARIESVEHKDCLEPNADAEKAWRNVRDAIVQRDLAAVTRASAAYLAASSANNPIAARLPPLLFFAGGNLATLLSIAVIALIAVYVEQVEGLFRNAGARAVCAIVLLIVAGQALLVGARVLSRARNPELDDQEPPPVFLPEAGASLLLKLRAQGRPPSKGLPRFQLKSHLREVYLATAAFCGVPIFIGCFAAWGIAAMTWGDAGRSAALAAAMLAVVGVVARVSDRYDFVTEPLVRVQALLILSGVVYGLLYSSAYAVLLSATALSLWNFAAMLIRIAQRRGYVDRIPAMINLSADGRASLGLAFFVLALWSLSVTFNTRAEIWNAEGPPGDAQTNAQISSPAIPPAAARPRPDGCAADEPALVAPQQWPRDAAFPPVVLIASGGGSRAAIYASLFLEQLHHEAQDVACALQAIGSVSGGSLTNAVYSAWRYQHRDTACSKLAPATFSASGKATSRTLTDRVRADFIYPTMKGVFHPRSRGDLVEEAFAHAVAPTGREPTLGDLAAAWRDDRYLSPPPLPIFHAANLERNAVVMSPLQARAFHPNKLHGAACDVRNNLYTRDRVEAERPTWVYYRTGVYGLDNLIDWAPGLPLSSAVRASANFPFGFPLVTIRTPRPLFFSADADRRTGEVKTVKLTDGGVLSNSGLWATYSMLMSEPVLSRLRTRGLVLLISEASKMPRYDPDDLIDSIRDKAPSSRRLHQLMIAQLFHALGGRLRVFQIDLPPREDANVMTTWVLPAEKVERLEADFSASWAKIAPDLKSVFRNPDADAGGDQHVNVLAPLDAPPLLERPPLD